MILTLGFGLKVLFLSSDTGGGHRASAESLGAQFELLFEGSSYDLLDLATEAYLPPYNSIVPYYKHLSAHPNQWKLIYGASNSRVMERVVETNIKVMTVVCERNIRKKIKAYHPDVVVSVHPLQTSVPILSCAKISNETGKHLPMFTVVTDLGSAHSTWFAGGVEKLFVGSTQIHTIARNKGIPEEKLELVGLPIRYDFAVESERLGDGRMTEKGKEYQREVREKLNLPAVDRKTLLVMGGGEGNGALSNIVDALYIEFVKQGVDAVIMVVCGRNEVLVKSLEDRNWDEVSVVPLGFVKNMAQYMVAADVLISKAGPGTISEAAALSLPVMLTSFLPGQEEGNVDYVVEGGFGSFCQDTDPEAVAEEVTLWLNDEIKLTEMSDMAKKAGHPYAARDIVKQIDLSDDEKEKEAIAKIVAEEEKKLSAELRASAVITSSEENSEDVESETMDTI
ncbi:UDP-Glycosyltransferase/glycogen phosphorylase [Fragilariopsis cylindrus CCMP1102]|uniref:monogalactosyldiacylglycerol synthase n=1 Tax=Fragilariopsis cylindrus CCMP1102 TaxID=635003 RepID=A0A1E7FEZ5_9STRA|nr:UDP-Glycosyltransferase/glycogen phosphorylase [Fragilariopsis cylindrus CCMP1102]|eukprot:OEU16730.1 UDP-Glycosyltransferase/glycogen phosphorylase [Fragilariopsis cylindrus CCMP1102]